MLLSRRKMCKILQLGIGLQKWLYNYSPHYQLNEYSNSEKAPGNITEARKPSGLPRDPLPPLSLFSQILSLGLILGTD